MWHVGKRELLAMVIGSLAYGLLLFGGIYIAVVFPDSPAIGEKIGDTFWFLFYGVNMFPVISALLSGCILAIPLFIGARFGPWTGLVCAIAGRFLGARLLSLLPLFAGTLPTHWFGQYKELYLAVYCAWALFGLIPGLASGMRAKRNESFTIIALLASVCAILLADFLLYFTERGYAESNYYGPLSSLWSASGVSLALSYLAALVGLVLLLFLAEYGGRPAQKFLQRFRVTRT